MPATRSAALAPGTGQVARDPAGAATGRGDAARNPPVIVLTTPYCGAGRLVSLLARHPDLACTSGTGMLPLCEQAMATWRKADGRAAASPSALAATATRALATSIIISVLARQGKRRWCEVAAANSPAAETFLGLFPGTQFVCLHRACPGFIRAALDDSPWGIADPAVAPFVRAYPASTVAALTACWVTHTESLLAFEQAHPRACLRVRVEDLAGTQHETAGKLAAFLGLDGIDGQAAPGESNQPQPAPEDSGHEADLPVDLIPPRMLAQADDLLRQLSYPALPAPRFPRV
jgi:Sulfotransferase family